MSFVSVETLFSGEVGFGAVVDQADGTTLTEVAGSDRYLVIEIAHGFHGDATPTIPTTITVGGQTLNVIEQESNPISEGSDDQHIGVAVANEAQIAAMTFSAGEANWSITFLTSNDNKVNVRAYWYEDIDQTAGVVDSDVSGDTTNDRTVSLTVAVGDFVIGLGTVRANGTISSADTVRGAALAAGGPSSWPESLVSELTATGTSQDITISTSIGSFAAMVAFAIRPAGAGGDPVLAADGGTFQVTGTAANLEQHRTLSADGGTYAWTGTPATLTHDSVVAGAPGAYSITGTAATLTVGSRLDAASGTFQVTGTAANLEQHRALQAVGGTFTVTGTEAALIATGDIELAADGGAFAVTGTAAGLLQGYAVQAEAGAFGVAGTVADLLYARLLDAEAGAYAWTGAAATLTRASALTPIPKYTFGPITMNRILGPQD